MSASDSESDLTLENAESNVENGEQEEEQRLDLQVEIESPSACQRHVTVTVPRSDIDRYLDKAFSEVMPGANVPGFRPGRAPRKLVESHYRKEVSNQVKGSLLLDSVTQITDEGTFSAISEPEFDIDAVEIPDDGPLVFEFDIEVRPDFEMPKWKGLSLQRPHREFTEADVDAHLLRILERLATLEPSEEPAADGDFVVVNVRTTHEQAELSEASEVTIRVRPMVYFSDGTIDKFDELMIGARPGDKRTTKAQLDNDQDAENLRGAEVDVELEVLDVKRAVLPEMNDQLLLALGGFRSEGELRDAVRDELQRQMQYYQRKQIREQITGLLTESAEWELPPDLLRRQARRELERSIIELRTSGFSNEDIQAHANLLRQDSLESTAQALKEHFILERIAEEENLEAEDADYDREIAVMAIQNHESPRSVRSRLEKRGMMDALRNQIVESKVLDRISEEATFEEVPYEPPTETFTAVELALAGRNQVDIPDAKYAGEAGELKQPVDRQ